MSEKRGFTNTFNGGVKQDIDKVYQPNNTMRNARNISLIFNRVSDTENGVSYSVSSIRGNKKTFSVCPGYTIVGHVETKRGAVIFLFNGTNSAIGEMTSSIDGLNVAYTEFFNDKNDPNGDKLNFGYENYISGFYIYENEKIERVYFAQKNNEKRVINLFLCKNETGSYYHNQNCQSTSVYPKWLSVHAMSARMDLFFPILKFKKRIQGSLKSGTYQIFVRYSSKDGHESVFSPETNRIFVTNAKMDGVIDGNAGAYKSNHHNRYMTESNVVTSEGLQFTLKDIDIRWDFIEVGYIYNTSDSGFEEAMVFKKIPLTNQSTIDVDLIKHSGYPITRGKINERFETILSVGETDTFQNICFDADIELLPDISISQDINIRPLIKTYNADEKGVALFSEKPNLVSRRDDNDPITNTSPMTNKISISRYSGKNEDYDIFDDYDNYKGQQFESLLQGYFRGETYPFAVIVFDRKGNPLWAEHIQDFKFPEQYDHGYSLTHEDGPNTRMKILGLMFDSIKLPKSKIRDKHGKLNVSGFSIVRANRIKRILHQGVIFPCIENPNCSTRTKNDVIVRPLPNENNNFQAEYGNFNNMVTAPQSSDSHQYLGEYIFCGKNVKRENGTSKTAYSSPYMVTYHSPDVLIEQSIKKVEESDFIRHIGQVHSKYTPKITIQGTTLHRYNKCYLTNILETPLEKAKQRKGRPVIGQTSRIKYSFLHNMGPDHLYEDTDIDFPEKDFSPLVGVEYGWCSGKSVENFASLQPNALVMKLKDIESVDISKGATETSSYRLVNYMVQPDSFYTEKEQDETIETRSYFGTGHFQPITDSILSTVPVTLNSNGEDSYTFNNVEVWGGDCYVNLFDFTRMYPVYSDKCDKVCTGFLNGKPGGFPDYSMSHIIPIESKYNLSLLYGRRFAANATNPQAAGCSNLYPNLSNGIMFQQPEDWGYNRVLNVRHPARVYVSKSKNFISSEKKPSSFNWTQKKINGESSDSFRKNYVGDSGDAVGEFGRIVSFVKIFNYLYVIQERAFGIMLVNSNQFFSTDASDIVISTGKVFSGINYISEEIGTIHKNSIWKGSGNSFGFVDSRLGSIIRFSQGGTDDISEKSFDDLITSITLQQSVVSHGTDLKDIISGYSHNNGQIFITFHNNEIKKTISYNEKLDQYLGEYDFYPSYYVKFGRNLFVQKYKDNGIYTHGVGKYGQFFDEFFDTSFKFIVKPNVQIDSFFDNGILYSTNSVERVSKILHVSRESTHEIPFHQVNQQSIVLVNQEADVKRGNIFYPMKERDRLDLKPRLCGKYLEITIFISNFHALIDGEDKITSISSFETIFREINN